MGLGVTGVLLRLGVEWSVVVPLLLLILSPTMSSRVDERNRRAGLIAAARYGKTGRDLWHCLPIYLSPGGGEGGERRRQAARSELRRWDNIGSTWATPMHDTGKIGPKTVPASVSTKLVLVGVHDYTV